MRNKIILGTVQFGLAYGINNVLGKPSQQEVFNTLSLANSAGITTLDTADQYGNSPELIAEFKKAFGIEFLVNTKFKVESDTSISQQLATSLQRLDSRAVEVYFYHRFQDLAQYPDVKVELAKLREASQLKKIGVSAYTNQEIEVAVNTPEVDVIQIPFNLLDNDFQRGFWIRKAKEKGKIVQARSIFLQGLFFKDSESYPSYLHPLRKYAVRLQSIAKASGMDMENICLSYALSQPDIDEVIIGVDSADQLKRNMVYAASSLDENIMKEISAINVVETDLLYPINWK